MRIYLLYPSPLEKAFGPYPLKIPRREIVFVFSKMDYSSVDGFTKGLPLPPSRCGSVTLGL